MFKSAQELVKELSDAGCSQQFIGERAGVGQAAISKIATGIVTDPLLSTYIALQTLHRERCGAITGVVDA